MKTKSKPHIWPTFSGIIMILCCAFFGYIFFDSIIIDKPMPTGLFIILGLFTTLGVWTFIIGIYYFKIILISSENISISFPFRFKKYRFKISELESHFIYNNSGRFINYESLHFQISDKRIFMISQYEFWNYKNIRDAIINYSSKGEISKYHNLSQVFILFVISLIMTFGIAGILELMNQIIK